MKRNFTRTVLISTVLLIVGGYFVYQYYLAPTYRNNAWKTINIPSYNEEPIRIGKAKKRGQVFSIELEINGKSSQNLHVLVGQNNKMIYQDIMLKKGAIDFAYKNDWYSDSCYIFLTTEKVSSEKLELKYRFLTLD